MAVLDPADLLRHALVLVAFPQTRRPSQIDLRRAVSASYYAVFHHVLTNAADSFVGRTKRGEQRYAIVYRSIDHAALKRVCLQSRDPNYKSSPDLKRFAGSAVDLQDRRNTADYDPIPLIRMSDARAAMEESGRAILLFDSIAPEERMLFLTQLAFKRRF